MLRLFAQIEDSLVADPYATEVPAEVSGGVMALIFGPLIIVWLVLLVVSIVSMWKLFEKAGQPGWASIVPIYNLYVLLQITGRPVWLLAVVLVGSMIPFVNFIVLVGFNILLGIDLAKSYGKDAGYAALLILLPIVGYPLLAFGDAKYVGPAAKSTSSAAPAA